MSDELFLPQVPEPKPEDPEDVSWALSTAEAMWARGDHSEGVKWVRKAAEAASDAEDDERSLELAKAAADLAGMLTKRGNSRASIHIEEEELMDATPPAPPPPRPVASKPPPPKPAPFAAPKPAATSVTKQVTTPSRPPAPLPSKTSQPPPALGARSGASKPFGAGMSATAAAKPAPSAPKSEPKSEPKKTRKSKVNLEAESRSAFPPDTSPDPVADKLGAETSETPIVEQAQEMMRRSRPELGSNDPTFVGNVNDIIKKKQAEAAAAASSSDDDDDRTAEEWDASPTQNLTGDEMGFPMFPIPNAGGKEDPRKTSVALPTPDFKSAAQTFAKPKGAAPASGGASARPAPPHDPGIVTTQAIRVVVWRDGNGVHVAPAGTVVSAITVDAVLVALDAHADLTAWLTQKGR